MVPFICITDFMDSEQVRRMLDVLRRASGKNPIRKLGVGVMMSYKTLNDIPSRWQNVFPPKERIADIFCSDEAYNCLHYADYVGNPGLWSTLNKAISYGGIGIQALQLDMIWPNPGDIATAVHSSRRNIEVILQIGKNAFEQVNNDPHELVRRLEDYHGVIQRVLLDKSMGQGLGMDAQGLLPFARAIKEVFPELGLVVAGGLGPTTLHLVEPLIQEFPDLSIDAQGRLRPSGSALDPIDWPMAENYLIRAVKMFQRNQH